jgi:hypothetical protein
MLVADRTKTDYFIREYWDKGWQYSSQFEFKDWSRIVSEMFTNPESVNLRLKEYTRSPTH